jgi:hypothetical protein
MRGRRHERSPAPIRIRDVPEGARLLRSPLREKIKTTDGQGNAVRRMDPHARPYPGRSRAPRLALAAIALLLAGCIQQGPAAHPSQAAGPSVKAPPPAEQRFHGTTRDRACLELPVGLPCSPSAGGGNDVFFVNHSLSDCGLSADVSWNASTPATQDLDSGAGWRFANGTSYAMDLAHGPSPLHEEASLPPIANWSVDVQGDARVDTAAGSAVVQGPQPFDLIVRLVACRAGP